MIQDYLMVNKTTNTVDNVITWDGNPDTWRPPEEYLMLIQATTPAKIWGQNADSTDFILVEKIGVGSVGFNWDGTACITNEPKPQGKPIAQPTTEGVQEL